MIKNFIEYCSSWLFDYIPNVSKKWYTRLLVVLTSVSGIIAYIWFLVHVYTPYVSATKVFLLFDEHISVFIFYIILGVMLLGGALHLLTTIVLWVIGVENYYSITNVHDIILYMWINILLLLLGITPIVMVFYVVYRLILHIIGYFRSCN